jgi:putative spermidine/putrescine transport system permease protein
VALALRGDAVPRAVRQAVLTLSGVASNFAGVPLAFAFLATLGAAGPGHRAAAQAWFGIDLYGGRHSTLLGVGPHLTYLYFQMPLMVLVIMPAVEGLKRDWARGGGRCWAPAPLQYTLRIVGARSCCPT